MKNAIWVTVAMVCGAVCADGLYLNGSWEFWIDGKNLADEPTAVRRWRWTS